MKDEILKNAEGEEIATLRWTGSTFVCVVTPDTDVDILFSHLESRFGDLSISLPVRSKDGILTAIEIPVKAIRHE